MAAPQIYRSTDSSAPVLTGVAGSLVAVLDGCLVAGYGAKSAAGWTKPFTATNAAVFRMGGGNQFYLDVNDNGASNGLTGASGKEAAVRGYEVMTAASTGTGPFPTTAQIAAATANWRKSATADATARAWFVAADDRSFVIGIADGDSGSMYKIQLFGDFYSLKAADGFRTTTLIRNTVNGAGTTGTLGDQLSTFSNNIGTPGAHIARTAAGTGGSVALSMTSVGSTWENNATFTNSYDGNIYQARLMLMVAVTGTPLRGWLRGLYQIITPGGLADGDTYSGSGEFAGRTFVVVKGFGGAGSPYDRNCLAIETTAWDASS